MQPTSRDRQPPAHSTPYDSPGADTRVEDQARPAKITASLWTTLIVAGLTLCLTIGGLAVLLIALVPGNYSLSLGQWTILMLRPAITVAFLLVLIIGIAKRRVFGYWMTVCFWALLLAFLVYRVTTAGLAGSEEYFAYENDTQRAGGIAANLLFLASAAYMVYATGFGGKSRAFFNRSRSE